MANTVYAKALEGFLGGTINWSSDTIKVVLVDNSYTPNFTTDQYLSSIGLSARLGTSLALTGKTVTGGVADAADVTISPGPVSGTIKYVVVFKDSGTDTTSPLIACLDTAGGTGLPATADGSDVSILWDNGANKIFHL